MVMPARTAERVLTLPFNDGVIMKVRILVELQEYTGPDDPLVEDFCEGAVNLCAGFVRGVAARMQAR